MKTWVTIAFALLCVSVHAQFQIGQRAFISGGTAPACGTYTHYRTVTIPSQSSLSADVTNYMMVVAGTYSYLATVANGGLVQNASGFDIAFYTDNTCATKLSWQTASWVASSGAVIYWVNIPRVSKTTAQTIVLAYDNSGITTDQSSGSGAWPSAYKGIYQLPDGSTLSVADTSSGANNGTNSGATATTGVIDGGAAVNGSSYVLLNSNGNLVAQGTAWTYQTWANASSFANAYNCTICENEDATHVFSLLVKSSGKLALYLKNSSGTFIDYDGTGSNTLSTGTWYLLTMTYSSSAGLVGYVNGGVDGTAAANGSLPTTASFPVDLGANSGIAGRTWNGSFDEARVLNVALPADWVFLDYASQSSPSTFYSIGAQH